MPNKHVKTCPAFQIPVLTKMTNPKGKRQGICLYTFQKMEVIPLATSMRIYKKGDVDIKGMNLVQKGNAPQRFSMAKLEQLG